MATRVPNGKEQFLNPTTGVPLAGGKVWHYVPGTSTLKDTYLDRDQNSTNANPVILDAYGSAVIWGNGGYRQVLMDSSNNTLWDQVSSTGVSDVMYPVTTGTTLAAAKTALGITAPWQTVIGGASLATGMISMGISAALQPVVGAASLALARTALGVDAVGLEVYNVKSYGAVGDGVANDTAAIAAAVTACSSGIVYFPPGVYKVMSTIFVKPGVAMWGTTPTSSTVVAGANNVNIFAYVASALTTGFEVRNLGFSGGGFTGCFGLFLDGVDATKRLSILSITNCYFALLVQGTYLNFCANIVMDSCFANVCTGGFWFSICADSSVTNCKAQNGTGIGFYVSGGVGAYDEGMRLLGCSTNGQAFGLGVTDQDWGVAQGCSFTTCVNLPVSLTNADNWRILGCEIAAAAAVPGMTIDSNCTSVQVEGCFFALNTFGLTVSGSRHAVMGNKFVGNSNVDLYLNNATQVTVTGNGCDSAGAVQSILEVGTANYNAVIGNCTNGTIVLVGAQSVAPAGSNVVY